MKILIFIFLFFSSNLYAEGLVNKSASLALKSLMTMVSMFDDIEKDMGENWEVAWRLDGFNERQETCQPDIKVLRKEMENHDEWNYIYLSLMMKGYCPEIQKDTDNAIKLMKELANNGHETAQKDLGNLYHKGSYGKIKNVVEPNLMVAIGYYKMAINQHNNAIAARIYSRLLMESDEIMNDYELAYEILGYALQNGKTAFENENTFITIFLNTKITNFIIKFRLSCWILIIPLN